MKSFKDYLMDYLNGDYLNESPMYIPQDAPFEEVGFDKITDISKSYMDEKYELVLKNAYIVKNEILDLYKHKDSEYYVLGRFYLDDEELNKKRFAVIFDVYFTYDEKFRSKQKQLKNKKVLTIKSVHTATNFRGNKISTNMYKLFLKNALIISDSIQYKGAKKLWKGLIQDKNITVWIYDILEDKIISKATSKTDERSIWSSDDSKTRIRLVAKYN